MVHSAPCRRRQGVLGCPLAIACSAALGPSVYTLARPPRKSVRQQRLFSPHGGAACLASQPQSALGVYASSPVASAGSPDALAFRVVCTRLASCSLQAQRSSTSVSFPVRVSCPSSPSSWSPGPLSAHLPGVRPAASSHTLGAPWLSSTGRWARQDKNRGKASSEEAHAKDEFASTSAGGGSWSDAVRRPESVSDNETGGCTWTKTHGGATGRSEGARRQQGDFGSAVSRQNVFDRILQVTRSSAVHPSTPVSPQSSLSSDSSFAAASLSRPTSSAPRSPLFPASFSDASARQDAEPNWQGTSADEEDDEALLQRLLLEHGIVDPRSEKTSTSTEPPAASLSERAEQSGEDGEQRGEIERATLLMPLQPLTSVAEAVGGFQRVPIDPRKTREELDEEVEAAIAHFVPAQYRKSETPQRATGPETEEDAVDGQSEEASAVAASWRGTHTRTGRGARSTSHANARAHETPGVGGEIACAEEQTGAHDGRQDAGDPGVVSRRMTGRAQCLPAGGATDESTSIVAFHEGQEEPGYPCRAEYMGDEAFAQNVLGVECRPRVFGQLATAGQAARPGRPETVLGPHAVVSQRGDDEQEPEAELTPAQRFYRDNRDLLLKRAQAYYHEKQQKLARQTDSSEAASIDDDETEAVDDEWAFFREPVVRPSKDHLWGVGWQQPAESPETGQRRDKTIELQSGRMPTVEEFVTILQQEYMEDIRVIDLEACGRRDVARFAIIGTGRTPAHCRRVGRLLSRLMVELQVPFLSRAAYCHSNRDDDWVIARCAHIHLHLMTRAVRSEYRLEDLWLLPHEHFGPETFPGYFDCSYSHPPPYLLAARDSAAYSAATSRDLKAYESLMESQDYPDASVHYQIDAPARLSGEIAKHKAGDEKFSTSDVERLAPDKK